MIRTIILTLSAVALAGSAAAAKEPKASAQKSATDRMICRTIEDTGQKLRRTRACHTAAEWRELNRETRQAIEHIQRGHATGT